MSFSGGKKILLLGFLFVLLAAIPLTVFFLQRQQEVRSRAVAATKLYFSLPRETTPTRTLEKKVGETFSLDVVIDPANQNQVSFLKLVLTYDPQKLEVSGQRLEPATTAFPAILEGPTYSSGNASVTLSVGPDPTKVITGITKVATITFKTLTPSQTTTTPIAFSDQTQALSISSSDQPSENVLTSKEPLALTIAGPAATPTPTPTPTPGASITNKSPICDTLNVDKTPSGTAPFSINFTANGRDLDGTIKKVTFDFGDGPVQDVTQAGGIGTNSVSVQVAHAYKNAGTFKAKATLTDNNDAVSQQADACTQTITVTAGTGTGGAVDETVVSAPTPTLVDTTKGGIPQEPGPQDTLIGIGAVGAILSIIGALVFFSL